jgi:hypothetical protein
MYDVDISRAWTRHECDELIDWFDNCEQKKHVSVDSDVIYSRHGTGTESKIDAGRYECEYVMTYSLDEEQTPFIRAIRSTIAQCLRPDVTFDWASIVKTYPGCGMATHIDRATIDTDNKLATKRVYTCILYLNDEYDGGRLVVPPSLRYKPVAGSLLQMVGSDHLHGVENIEKAFRYTMSVWFTINDI